MEMDSRNSFEIWKWKMRERVEWRKTPRLLASVTLWITEVFTEREGYQGGVDWGWVQNQEFNFEQMNLELQVERSRKLNVEVQNVEDQLWVEDLSLRTNSILDVIKALIVYFLCVVTEFLYVAQADL